MQYHVILDHVITAPECVLSKLYWQITFVQGWGQFLFCNSIPCPIPIPWLSIPIPFYYPSALWAGGVLSYRYSRVGGQTARLCGMHISETGFSLFKAQWNCLDLKLCNVMIICQFTPYGLANGSKLVKTGTNGVQTLRNAYLCIWNRWTLHSDEIVWTCICATSWSFTHLPHMVLPMGQKVVKSGTTGVLTLRNAYLWNHWMGLHRSEFYGIVKNGSCAISWAQDFHLGFSRSEYEKPYQRNRPVSQHFPLSSE